MKEQIVVKSACWESLEKAKREVRGAIFRKLLHFMLPDKSIMKGLIQRGTGKQKSQTVLQNELLNASRLEG
jgi:hypothetical protein